MYNIALYTMLFPYIHSIFHCFQITLQNNVHKPQQPTVCVCVCVCVCGRCSYLPPDFSFLSSARAQVEGVAATFATSFYSLLHTDRAHALNRNTGSVTRSVHNRPGSDGTQKVTLWYIALRLFSVRFIALIQRRNVETDKEFCLVGLFVVKEQ